MRETNLSGRNTRKERNIRKSTSTFASANIVIDLREIPRTGEGGGGGESCKKLVDIPLKKLGDYEILLRFLVP